MISKWCPLITGLLHVAPFLLRLYMVQSTGDKEERDSDAEEEQLPLVRMPVITDHKEAEGAYNTGTPLQ